MEGIFGSEAMDTAGEVLNVENSDISELKTGKAQLNCEHINPSDIPEKENLDKEEHKQFYGFQSIVGRVIDAKKIFSEKDCDSENQLKAWDKLKVPLIYGWVEIYDGPKAPENAKALAQLVRTFEDIPDGPELGLSVEGSVLERKGHILNETVIRRMAATLKPANKSAIIQISNKNLKDDSARSDNTVYKTADEGGQEFSRFSSLSHFTLTGQDEDFGLEKALQKLKKALDAGSGNQAPSQATQGSSLQTEDLDGLNVATLQKQYPKLSKDKLAKITKFLLYKKIKKNTGLFEDLYESLFKA